MFYRTVPKEDQQYLGIVKLLLHFKWDWIGLIAPNNDNGERFLSTLTPLVTSYGICIASSHRTPRETDILAMSPSKGFFLDLFSTFVQRRNNVFIIYGDYFSGICIEIVIGIAEQELNDTVGKVWITTALLDITLSSTSHNFNYINASLSFVAQANQRSKYDEFSANSGLIEFVWKTFHCLSPKPVLSVKGWTRCTENNTLESFPQNMTDRLLSQDSYRLYNALHTMAHALNAAYSSRSQRLIMADGEKWEHQRIQPWQVFLFPET